MGRSLTKYGSHDGVVGDFGGGLVHVAYVDKEEDREVNPKP